MIRFSVLYPKTEGATFDHDYYANSHVPLAVKTWGLDGAQIDKGLDGPYEAVVHFTFESMDSEASLAPSGAAKAAGDHFATLRIVRL